jgi:hypothetical protein
MSDCKPCQTKKCKPNQCGCAVLISSDCVNDVKSVFTNLDIPTGLPLTQTLELIDEAFGLGNIVNVGTGVGVYKGTALNGDKQLKSLKSTDNSVTITTNEANTEINFSVNTSAPPEVCITSEDESVAITEKEGCFDLSVSFPTPPEPISITSSNNTIEVTETDGVYDLDITLTAGTNMTIDKVGTEYTFNTVIPPPENPQKTLTQGDETTYTLQAEDNFKTIFLTITSTTSLVYFQIPTGLPNNFTCSVVLSNSTAITNQLQILSSTQTVVTPNGYSPSILGKGNWLLIERNGATTEYYVMGNLQEL